MPLLSTPFTLAKLNDSILGAFALVPQSQELDHVVRYLSTWSGSELSMRSFAQYQLVHFGRGTVNSSWCVAGFTLEPEYVLIELCRWYNTLSNC